MTSVKHISGFSNAMDWRPVEFVDLLPARCCCLCNVVPKETFILECSHALCNQCYQAVLQGKRQCPLDGGTIQEEEVQGFTFKPSHLKKQKLRCCNSSHGCDFVGNLEDITTHFLNDCEFHVVSCNRCHATVQRRDIVSHCSEQRCHTVSSSIEGSQVSADKNDIETKIDESLETVMQRLCAIDTQVNNHAVGIDSAKVVLDKVLEQQGRTAAYMTQVAAGINSLQRNYAELQVASHSNTQKIEEFVGLFIRMDVKLDIVKHTVKFGTNEVWCHFRDFEMFLREGEIKEEACRSTDAFLLCGYCAQLNMVLKHQRDSMYLGLYLIIGESKNDLLKWPLLNVHRYILLHPSDQLKNIEKSYDYREKFRSFGVSANRMRPTSTANIAFADFEFCTLGKIRDGGFIVDDAVCIGVILGVPD
ncbi:uncharacterized protein LOC135393294 [Ornithodoros turicata]|uniref:uncharacterized protein LOC135393294 n=1 Tax=Ornithodoros turicata TaxID=34597 RepID=UPI003138EE1B